MTNIPKKIHYVWVGNKKKPELILKCIESWKKHCPDYEIIEWDNEKYEQIKNVYSTHAFEHKKWAFVSDYIRLYALYNEGGIYIDSDVEITDNIDEFLIHDFFSGFEYCDKTYSPITALMGAKKGNKIIKNLLDYYLHNDFVTKSGKLDLEPNTKKITKYFKEEFGLKKPYDGTRKIELTPNQIIYPSSYFCNSENGAKNYAIHHFNGSWLGDFKRKDYVTILGYTLSKFKKYKTHSVNELLPISNKEQIVKQWQLSKEKTIVLIKKKGVMR